MNKLLVSVVAPVYNEEAAIDEFVSRLSASANLLSDRYDFEFVLVDDGSKDKTLAIVKAMLPTERRLRIVELRKNYGQTQALQAGLDNACGEIVITMDSDLQHFPEEIPNFLQKIEEGYDIVCGWRHKRAEGIVRRWPSRVANYFLKALTNLDLHDFGTTFRAYRGEIVSEIRLLGEFHRYLPVLGKSLGARITEIPIENIERPRGNSNYGLARTFGVSLDIVLLFLMSRYLDRPMRIFGMLGMVCFALGAAIVGVLFVMAYSMNIQAVREHQGWFIISVFLLTVSFQMILTGFLAEIMVRVHYDLKDNRVYRCRHVWSRSELASKSCVE